MVKMLQFDQQVLQSLSKGVTILSKAVAVTLGPQGNHVVIHEEFGSPFSTKDGASVAKSIILKNNFENMGAQLVKESALKTAATAGDGTTTSVVLTQAIFKEGVKHVAAGANPMAIKRGIDKATTSLIEALDRLATPVKGPEAIKQIATISANNDPEIGSLIGEAIEKVGREGTITTAEGQGIETTLEVVKGVQTDKGYHSPYFVTNPEKMNVEFSHARILLVDHKLSNLKDLATFLQKSIAKESSPLLIIADDFDTEVLSLLVTNKLQGGFSLAAVQAPAFGERRQAILEDIAVATGGQVVSSKLGMSLSNADSSVLGRAHTVQLDQEKTTIIGGLGKADLIEKRAQSIRHELNNVASDYDRKNLEERLAHLKGGVALIHVGGATETEMKERKARLEDALHATRAAAKEGVVPGGGVALIRAQSALDKLQLTDDEKIGADIVRKAAFTPAITIANNCGKNGDLVAQKISEGTGAFGYNGLKDQFEDLNEAGVIDPVFVTKQALKHASSIASLLITVTCIVTDKPTPKKASAPQAGPPGMGGGMMPGMGMM